MKYLFKFLFLFLFFSFFFIKKSVSNEPIIVYSARSDQLIKPILDKFTEKTGIKINLFTTKANALLARLDNEGSNTSADLIITNDAGNLWLMKKKNLLLRISSKKLEKNIPSHLRDPNNFWFGLSVRARTIFYNRNKVNVSELSTYEDLGSEKWNRKLCLRTSKKIYNQSLIAMMIYELGEEKTEKIIKGWVKNLATNVFPSDTKVLKAIASGECHVGIANSYYLGRLISKDPKFPVDLFWANQKENGVHVNISGGAISKFTKNKNNTVKLIEYLSSDEAQKFYANEDFEYPVNLNVNVNSIIEKWGLFKQNPINVSKAGELQVKAIKLMDRAKYK